MRGNLPHTHGNSLMGATISVFWLDEHRWYTGTVKEFDRVSGWHVVAYEDGEQREEPLNDPQLLWKLGVHVDDVSQRGQSDDMAMHVEQDAAGREPGGKAIAGEVEVSVEAMSDSEGGSEAGGDDADEIQSVEAVQVFPCEDAESDALFEQRGFGVARNDEDDEEVVETYSVERVMAEKDGKFLVRWAGYSAEHDTWEPEDSFVNPLPIELFRSSQAAAGRSADGGSSSASARNECADCGRAFDTPHGLTIHRSKGLCGGGKVPKPVKEPPPLPNADGRYQCLNCGTTFDKPHGLLIHRARHCTGEFRAAKEPPPLPNADGRYECLNCGLTFEKLHGLSIHRTRHCNGQEGRPPKEQKPLKEPLPSPNADGLYECTLCHKTFVSPHGVAIHRGSCKGELSQQKEPLPPLPPPNADGRYECGECGRVFDKAHGLTIHRGSCTRAPKVAAALAAPKAPPPPTNADGLYECDACGETFPKVQGLNLHRSRYCTGEAKGRKGPAPKRESLVPNAAGRYDCNACGRSFDKPHGLVIHQNTCMDINRPPPSKVLKAAATAAMRNENGKRPAVHMQAKQFEMRDSILPPPAAPPMCRCGQPAVWARRRYWCAVEENGGCGYEAIVPPPTLSTSPLCDCGELAVWDRDFWWCAIRSTPGMGGSADYAALGEGDLSRVRRCSFRLPVSRTMGIAKPQAEARASSSGELGHMTLGTTAADGETAALIAEVLAAAMPSIIEGVD